MRTTRIFIYGDEAYMLASDLSDFTGALSSFASFCLARQGNTKNDYVNAFKNVKGTFYSLIELRELSDWTIQPVNNLIEKVEQVLNGERINDVSLGTIYNLVMGFLRDEIYTQSSQSFKHDFLEEAIYCGAQQYYSKGLLNALNNSLEAENYDAAVLDSFKYLDGSLRSLTGIVSSQIYGEDLINKVFSPNSGLLQINTHPNEQIGLRNWFSGANALFRNPLAHRFVNLDEKSAFPAILMVSLMLKIAEELSKNNKKTD